MNLFKIDLSHLALSGAVGVIIHFIFLLNDMNSLVSVSRSALIGIIVGLLIQAIYKVSSTKIKHSMLWTNIIVCASITVVLLASNLLMGNTNIQSVAEVLLVSLIAGIAVVFFQFRYYKMLNTRLEKMKRAQMEKNKD